MKSLVLTFVSLSIAIAPLTQTYAAETTEKALTDVERMQKNAKDMSPEDLELMAKHAQQSVAFFEKAVNDTQISLDGKKLIQGYYFVNLRVQTFAIVIGGVSALSAVGSSGMIARKYGFSKEYQQGVFNSIKESTAGSNFEGVADDALRVMMEASDGASAEQASGKIIVRNGSLGRLPVVFGVSAAAAALSGLAYNYALTAQAKLNENDIKTLETALAKLTHLLQEQRMYAKFLEQQANLKGKLLTPEIGLFPKKTN